MVYLQWDPEKAKRNFIKHKVSFLEASTVFFDPDVMVAEDTWHSEKESRLLAIGISSEKRVLFVSFTFRRAIFHEKEVYRIISARTANKKERKAYNQES